MSRLDHPARNSEERARRSRRDRDRDAYLDARTDRYLADHDPEPDPHVHVWTGNVIIKSGRYCRTCGRIE